VSSIRETLERRERETLAPQAAKSADSRGRLRPEAEDDVRPRFSTIGTASSTARPSGA
jgi:dGTPase